MSVAIQEEPKLVDTEKLRRESRTPQSIQPQRLGGGEYPQRLGGGEYPANRLAECETEMRCGGGQYPK